MTWLDRHMRSSRPWRLRVLRRRPLTRCLLAFAVLMMLGQQTAMAAYACAIASAAMAPMTATSTAASTGGGDDGCAETQPLPDQVVCHYHCSPQVTTPAVAQVASVPGNGLTALPPMLLAVATGACQSSNTFERRYRKQALSPPPTKLFCSLQI
jgi:hypothetical protein